jgi:hypothetical protein
VQWKTEDEVLPRMQTMSPKIAKEVRKKMVREDVKGTKEELNAIFSKRFNETVSASRIYAPAGLISLTRP